MLSPPLEDKMFYTALGFVFTGFNYALLGTRFNVAGAAFGLVALYCFLKALQIKK